MKKSLLAVVTVVIVVTMIRGIFSSTELTLEVYRQAGEGDVQMVGEVTDPAAIDVYDDIYQQMEFVHELSVMDYPDAAVYRRDGTGVIHHTNIWFRETGDGLMQQINGGRKAGLLNEAEARKLKRILQLPEN